jgi:hypothetical protein
MTLKIDLSSEQEALLIQEAARHGVEASEYVRRMIERQLSNQEGGQSVGAPITPEERARAFRAWAESHDRNTPLLTEEAISRESIYQGRG